MNKLKFRIYLKNDVKLDIEATDLYLRRDIDNKIKECEFKNASPEVCHIDYNSIMAIVRLS